MGISLRMRANLLSLYVFTLLLVLNDLWLRMRLSKLKKYAEEESEQGLELPGIDFLSGGACELLIDSGTVRQ